MSTDATPAAAPPEECCLCTVAMTPETRTTTDCGHAFCGPCLRALCAAKRVRDLDAPVPCPLCRAVIDGPETVVHVLKIAGVVVAPPPPPALRARRTRRLAAIEAAATAESPPPARARTVRAPFDGDAWSMPTVGADAQRVADAVRRGTTLDEVTAMAAAAWAHTWPGGTSEPTVGRAPAQHMADTVRRARRLNDPAAATLSAHDLDRLARDIAEEARSTLSEDALLDMMTGATRMALARIAQRARPGGDDDGTE